MRAWLATLSATEFLLVALAVSFVALSALATAAILCWLFYEPAPEDEDDPS